MLFYLRMFVYMRPIFADCVLLFGCLGCIDTQTGRAPIVSQRTQAVVVAVVVAVAVAVLVVVLVVVVVRL